MSAPAIAADLNRWLDRHRATFVDEICALVAVDTTSPNEAAVHTWLRDYFAGLAGTVHHLPRHPDLFAHPAANHNEYRSMSPDERGSLRVEFPAPDAPPEVHTLFSAHIDVVPAGPDFRDAFAPRVVGDRIVGRGTADTKGNLVMLAAALRFLRDAGVPLRRRVSLDLVPEEEIGGNGALSSVLYGSDASDVVVLEPTSLEVFHGHRGCAGFTVDVRGRSSHMGGRGVSAIDGAVELVTLVRELEEDLLREARTDPAFAGMDRPMQINIGMIDGGEWAGSVPERCTVRGFFGYHPRHSATAVLDFLRELVGRLGDPWLREHTVVSPYSIHNEAYLGDPDDAVAQGLRAAVRATGADVAERRAWNVSCDARLYQRLLGVPTVVFGAGSLVDAHSSHEGIDLTEWTRGVEALVTFLTEERVRC
jgi:acetylornithine deacetylase